MEKTEITVKEWLTELSTCSVSTGEDDRRMQSILHRFNFPKAVCTCGMVYLEGQGQPMDIHNLAKIIVEKAAK